MKREEGDIEHSRKEILYTRVQCAGVQTSRPVGQCATVGDTCGLWLSEQIDLRLDTGTSLISHWLIYEEASYFAQM